ncbi:HlyD family type I secretion periplasmic adaptor subunit [Legionella israelensis]|uniref:Membrane fusion protein (MFP) family protein n=1 Tax=Legionella israelensis TaxID=454 RepID=A0A0W0VGX9_9GAMM|nr:HlyD family type I secretion periplasmic adaptor subunit [Legionella israelensis]KTD19406.1 secretion system protein D [Legionella israelensis]QBS08623.1 HlyD family type I secretion periplasmic adaptor subunit [Legionella israelensis]SCY09536.1 membrane fusion protein, adhesin transport system [Legionella israelensis DSM 19235]STX58285.1 HlyD family secretion protein [Legionella israelensis]
MAKRHRSRLFGHIILWTSVLFIAAALIWAYYAKLDEVTTGSGKVIPSSEIQVIQNLEGGIVEKIMVSEGDIVKKGQTLMQIDNTLFMATYNEALKKMTALELEIIRLNALMQNKPLSIPQKYIKSSPNLVQVAEALDKSKKQELEQMNKALALAERELKLTRPLVSRGAVSEVEVLRLERTINELKGKISEFKSKALERLNQARSELLALKEAHMADKDRVTRTTVRSPVKGIINRIKINTMGGVIKPGMDIIEIVPLEDTLLIEAKIRPGDIGFIHPGQKAMVKISAYDFSIYGGLEGKVEQISADTITEEKSNNKEESFYVIRVRTEKNHLGTEKNPLPIIPGMLATVDILTGEKTVLEYILKPIIKAQKTALRER